MWGCKPQTYLWWCWAFVGVVRNCVGNQQTLGIGDAEGTHIIEKGVDSGRFFLGLLRSTLH